MCEEIWGPCAHTYNHIYDVYLSVQSVPTHDGGEAESKAQSQGHLAGHAAPILRLSEEDDGAEEGHHQREQQRETQQRIVCFHQRRADVHHKHHLEHKKDANTVKHNIWTGSVAISTLVRSPLCVPHPNGDGN